MTEQIIFYALAVILIFAASMMITVRNPVRAALFLVLAFFTSAAIWLLLEAEYERNQDRNDLKQNDDDDPKALGGSLPNAA